MHKLWAQAAWVVLWLSHLLAGWLWESYLTSWHLHFSIIPLSWGCYKNRMSEYEILRIPYDTWHPLNRCLLEFPAILLLSEIIDYYIAHLGSLCSKWCSWHSQVMSWNVSSPSKIDEIHPVPLGVASILPFIHLLSVQLWFSATWEAVILIKWKEEKPCGWWSVFKSKPYPLPIAWSQFCCEN